MDTAKKMYEYFLTEVRKERNTTISPDMWSAYVNPIFVDWVKTKLPTLEFTQKRLDDLEAIKVLTDGVQYPILPSVTDKMNIFDLPYSTTDYPKYLYGLSASFQNYYGGIVNEPEDDDGGGNPLPTQFSDSDLIGDSQKEQLLYATSGKILRSDVRVMVDDNPYRQTSKDTYVYYEVRGGRIYVKAGDLEYNGMILEYYSYPDEVLYNGSIDKPGSFKYAQNKEVMDMAVSLYLGRISDPRLQSQASLDSRIPK